MHFVWPFYWWSAFILELEHFRYLAFADPFLRLCPHHRPVFRKKSEDRVLLQLLLFLFDVLLLKQYSVEERKELLNYNSGNLCLCKIFPYLRTVLSKKNRKSTHIKRKAFMLAFPELFWENYSEPLNKKIFRGVTFLSRS